MKSTASIYYSREQLNLRTMPTGKMMDALVHDFMSRPGGFFPRVRINGRWIHAETWLPLGSDPAKPPGGTYAGQMPPEYSTMDNIALRVMNSLVNEFAEVEIKFEFGKVHIKIHDIDLDVFVNAEKFSEGICRAALLAWHQTRS